LEATLRKKQNDGKGGLLLASYDCKEVRFLPECRVNGAYAYQPVTAKEELVRMSDADSVRARLPTFGSVLPARLEGSLARGSSLDLALVMTGRWSTDTRVVYGKGLPSACQTATHFVRSVPTGAFAMGVGSQANVRAVAEVFGAGAQGESESAYLHNARDGELSACREPATTGPTPGCAAPLRIELVRLDPRREQRAKCENDGDMESCAWWWNFVFDKEIDAIEAPEVVGRMVALCRKGEVGACLRATSGADLYEQAFHRNLVDREWLEQRACDVGEQSSCVHYAERLEREGQNAEAFRLREYACMSKGGGGSVCGIVADLVEAGRGPADPAQRRQYAADLRARACLGSSSECTKYALLYRAGLRARGDFGFVSEILRRCEEHAFGCSFAAAAYALGIGTSRDLARAKKLYTKFCAQSAVQNAQRGKTCELPQDWQ
jgi:hypothetical protein